MDFKSWSKFEEQKCKLENRSNKLFIRWKNKKQIKKLKEKNDKLNEIKEYIETNYHV